jgi:predicted RNase H-like HicB family nuclease
MVKKQPKGQVRERGTAYRPASRRAAAGKAARIRRPRVGEYAYVAVFEPAEEGGYVVRFPAFGWLATQGDTLADARAMAIDCLEGHIDWLLRDGEELPPADAAAGPPIVEIIRIKRKVA